MLWRFYIVMLTLWSAGTAFTQNVPVITAKLAAKADSNFFISKVNDVYGFGNGKNWYINTPTGDTAFYLGNSFLAVRNGSKGYTLYDQNFKSLHHSVKTIREFGKHLLLKDALGSKIMSVKDSSVTEYFDSVCVHGTYAWLFKNGKQGLLHRDWGLAQRIAPLYEQVGPYCNGILLMDRGKLGWKGVIDIPVEFDHIYKSRTDIIAAKNKSGPVYYSLLHRKKLLIDPTDSVVFYNKFYKRVAGNKQSIFSLSTNELIGEVQGYELHPYSFNEFTENNSYCIISKNSMCALFSKGKRLTDFAYDNFLADNGIHPPFFRVVKNNKVGIINDSGQWQLKPLYADVIDRKKEYYIVRNGKTLGLRLKGDSMILPMEYKAMDFFNGRYVTVSKDGILFGLYDFINGREITPMRYKDFEGDSTFVLARKGKQYDVYFNGELKFEALSDAEINATTVKGYKEGKVFMGYCRKGGWEEYSYAIPSYKVIAAEFDFYDLRAFRFVDEEDVYDYSTGKWGRYNFNTQQWAQNPLAHGGNLTESGWLLDFEKDTLMAWSGIHFYSPKSVAPLQIAWDKASRFRWIDVKEYSYSNPSAYNNRLGVSPICYELPGKGKCMENFKSTQVNAIFGNSISSILAENGRVELAKQGEISLADYISQLSESGNIYPASISDYKKVLDPTTFVKITGASEHILHVNNGNQTGIPVGAPFEWIDKQRPGPFVFRLGNKYGMLSDSGTSILKPEFESIEPVASSTSNFVKTGLPSQRYKIYNPKTKKLSGLLAPLLAAKDELILLQLSNGKKIVLNQTPDTVIISNGSISLLGGADFSIKDSINIKVYRNTSVLFSYQADSVEKINDGHFLIRTYNTNLVVNDAGDPVFKSQKAIKYLALGNQYLLDDGLSSSVFTKDNSLLCSFSGGRYTINNHQDLFIKEDNSVTIIRKNKQQKVTIKGKFEKASGNYLVLKHEKYKQVFSYEGELLLKKIKQVKIVNDDYLAYHEGKSFFLLNVLTLEKTKIKSMNVDLTKEGIECEDMQENIQVIPLGSATDTLLIAERNGRYGLLSGDNNVLPYAYFQIRKLTAVYLVQDHCEYKLFNIRRCKFVSNQTFENIYAYKNNFMILKNGKISYLNGEGEFLRLNPND